MALRDELVELKGKTYRVRELSAREMGPLMAKMQDIDPADESQKKDFSQTVFELAVEQDGIPVSLDDTPGWAYLRLLPKVMALNGLTEGND